MSENVPSHSRPKRHRILNNLGTWEYCVGLPIEWIKTLLLFMQWFYTNNTDRKKHENFQKKSGCFTSKLPASSSCTGAVGRNVPCEFDWLTGLIRGVWSSLSVSLILSSVDRLLRRLGSPLTNTFRLHIGQTRRFLVSHGSIHLLWNAN